MNPAGTAARASAGRKGDPAAVPVGAARSPGRCSRYTRPTDDHFGVNELQGRRCWFAGSVPVATLFMAQGTPAMFVGASWNRAYHPSLDRAPSTARIASAHSLGVATEVSTSTSYFLNVWTRAC